MKTNYSETIIKNQYYILRKGSYLNGKTDFMCMSMNTPENRYLNVTMIGFEECSPEKEDRIHTFEGNTIHFILKGKGTFDGVTLSQNDCFAVRKNHIAEYAPDYCDPWTYCWINFNGSMADKLLHTASINENKCTFSLQNISKIHSLIMSALEFDYTNADVGMHLNSVLLEIFASLMINAPETFSSKSDSVMENRVRRSIDFINENYKEKKCIDILSKKENVNKRYLSRLFRQYSDLSPQGHLIRVRIENAKSLLRTSKMTIGDVGESVGYDDVMQFSKIFKKHTGVSPTAYRNGKMDIIRKYE